MNLYKNIFTKRGRDKVADCRKDADDRLANCLSAANREPFPFNIAAIATCHAEWMQAQAYCLVASN